MFSIHIVFGYILDVMIWIFKTQPDSYYEVSNNIHWAGFQLFIFLIRRIYSNGRHCLQPFKLAECWFDHLSLRWDHLSIIFSHLSPPPYFAYLTKTTIHHGTLKYNVEPLEPTAENTRACSDISTPLSLVLSPRFSLAQFGAESQMLIWFQSNICVFNVEHLPLINWFWHWYNFISGEGTQYRPEQRGLSRAVLKSHYRA